MMLPNQINSQRFSTVGKGGYRASEVDAFIQRVFQNYNRLYNENNVLKERLSVITPLIDEYNENKKSIADALIWAKATSDKTVEQAQQEAKEIIATANAEGERIIAEKTAEAQAVYSQELNSTKAALEDTKTELEMTRSQAKSFSERYISEINSKAIAIVEDANANASKIVADAYKDAQTARDKADAIISKANEELAAIKTEASKLKAEIEKAAKIAAESVEGFSVYEIESQTVLESEKIEAAQIDVSEVDEFTFDFYTELKDSAEADDGDDNIADGEMSLTVENVEEAENLLTADKKMDGDDDLISGGSTAAAMPDVSAYISKIFDTAGNEDSDFSSFADGLNDAFAHSLEDSDISFEDLKKTIESGSDDKKDSDDEQE